MIPADRLRRIAAWSRDLEPDSFERACAGCWERDYPGGVTICSMGEPFELWSGVSSGLIKMRTLSMGGKEMALSSVHAGGWFGEGSVLKDELRRYDIVTLRPTVLAFMDRKTFMWLHDNSLPFSRFLVQQLNERLGIFIAMLENERMLDATGRVARVLALMLNPILYPDANNKLDLTQEEIGLIAGVSRPTANQALKTLQAAGMLTLEYGGIAVLDMEKLRAYGGET